MSEGALSGRLRLGHPDPENRLTGVSEPDSLPVRGAIGAASPRATLKVTMPPEIRSLQRFRLGATFASGEQRHSESVRLRTSESFEDAFLCALCGSVLSLCAPLRQLSLKSFLRQLISYAKDAQRGTRGSATRSDDLDTDDLRPKARFTAGMGIAFAHGQHAQWRDPR